MSDIVIAGGGFAGLWAALSAQREIEEAAADIRVTVISDDDHLTLRPRLYEAEPERFRVPLRPILDAVGVAFMAGRVSELDSAGSAVACGGDRGTVAYDRLILATGSQLAPFPVPGAEAHAFDVDNWRAAMALDAHLANLATSPQPPGGDTVVVIGGGFTGIEIATEMRDRITRHAGPARAAAARVVLLEQADVVGKELGDNPRPAIEAALAEARVEIRLGAVVSAINGDGVSLSNGESIAAQTVVVAVGMRASPLTAELGVDCDPLGRLPVDEMLRVIGVPRVYATGDVAHATVDDDGNTALMSCQHAMTMGRYAGYNAARDLLGLTLEPYRQARYVTCLDLGRSGAVFTQGWSREVEITGAEAKKMKRRINGEVIYPPTGDKAEILAAATLVPAHHKAAPSAD